MRFNKAFCESLMCFFCVQAVNVRQRVKVECTTDGTPGVEDPDALGRHEEHCLGLDDDQVGLVGVGVVRVYVIWTEYENLWGRYKHVSWCRYRGFSEYEHQRLDT